MTGDGASAVPPLGATGGIPVEVMEARYPVRVESMGLAQDSGGAGTQRGGLGVFREYRMLIDGVSASAAGSAEAGPAGGAGASPGKPYEMRRRSGKKSAQAPAVGASAAFSKGDSIRVSTPRRRRMGRPQRARPPRTCAPTCCAASSHPRRRRRSTAWCWAARRAFKSMRTRPENKGRENNFALFPRCSGFKAQRGIKTLRRTWSRPAYRVESARAGINERP